MIERPNPGGSGVNPRRGFTPDWTGPARPAKSGRMRGFRDDLATDADRLRRLATGFVIVGLVLRLVHYLQNYTIWYDESVLLFNVLDKDYGQLVGPLDHAVAAPPLFVWLLHFLGTTFGDHSYLWRLVPFAGGCLLLGLTHRLARRFLSPLAGATLVGLVTFSDAHVWLGGNVKPYIFDALAGTLLIYLFLASRGWPLPNRLLAFAVLAPPLMAFSYPAVFLYGGVLFAFLPQVVRPTRSVSDGTAIRRSRSGLVAYAVLAVAVTATFAVLYFGPMRDQRAAGLVAEWANKFPDWHRPQTVPGWIAGNFFLVCHYCYNPVGAPGVGLAVLGALECRRAGRTDLLLLLAGPMVLCLLACCLHAYPFSNNRLVLFLAPGFGVLVVLGVPAAVGWLRRRTRFAVPVLLAAVLLPGAAYAAYRVVKPWDRPNSSGVARLIRHDRLPGDLVASDEPGYRYFFMGELRGLADVAKADPPAGQRVWVPIDHYSADERRALARHGLRPDAWELLDEVQFNRASVFVFVKRP